MKAWLLAKMIQAVIKLLTPDLLREFVDMVLDFIEDKVEGTASTVDDALVLPLCDLIRKTFDVPDDD